MHQPTSCKMQRQPNSRTFRAWPSLAVAIVLLIALGCEKPADQPDGGAQSEPNEPAAAVSINDANDDATTPDPNNANEPAQTEPATPKPPAVTERDVAPLRSQVESLWERVCRVDPWQGIGKKLTDANSLLQTARAHGLAGRWAEARSAYRRAIEPLRVIENLNSARRGAILERKSLQAVLAAAKKAKADLSSITGAETGEQAFEAGQFERATTLWQQARANVLVAMARKYQLSGNWPAAKQALTIARLIDPHNVAAKALAKRTGKVSSYKEWPFDADEARRRQKETANALGFEKTIRAIELAKGVTMKLVLIPAGRFRMGSPSNERGRVDDDEGPQRMVTITRPFWIGMHEVTVEQFAAFVKDTGYETTAEKEGSAQIFKDGKVVSMSGASWKSTGFTPKTRQPVVCVTRSDAMAFCRWLSKRTKSKVTLPTEARWEYACRAGSAKRFCFGSDPGGNELSKYAWYASNSQGNPHTVGKKKANSWGLHDMHGNVWEWCTDYYRDGHPNQDEKDPRGPKDGSRQVIKGGSWHHPGRACRAADRYGSKIGTRTNYTGFRICQGQ